MIINGEGLLRLKPITPMEPEKKTFTDSKGRKSSYGLTECGYDIRLAQDIWLFPGRRFILVSSFEYFNVPNHVMGRVLNKSSWARMGVDVSRSTNMEPGWKGFLTLEITYSKLMPLFIPKGHGIAQIIFEQINSPAQYVGKYQNQEAGPVAARF